MEKWKETQKKLITFLFFLFDIASIVALLLGDKKKFDIDLKIQAEHAQWQKENTYIYGEIKEKYKGALNKLCPSILCLYNHIIFAITVHFYRKTTVIIIYRQPSMLQQQQNQCLRPSMLQQQQNQCLRRNMCTYILKGHDTCIAHNTFTNKSETTSNDAKPQGNRKQERRRVHIQPTSSLLNRSTQLEGRNS